MDAGAFPVAASVLQSPGPRTMRPGQYSFRGDATVRPLGTLWPAYFILLKTNPIWRRIGQSGLRRSGTKTGIGVSARTAPFPPCVNHRVVSGLGAGRKLLEARSGKGEQLLQRARAGQVQEHAADAGHHPHFPSFRSRWRIVLWACVGSLATLALSLGMWYGYSIADGWRLCLLAAVKWRRPMPRANLCENDLHPGSVPFSAPPPQLRLSMRRLQFDIPTQAVAALPYDPTLSVVRKVISDTRLRPRVQCQSSTLPR